MLIHRVKQLLESRLFHRPWRRFLLGETMSVLSNRPAVPDTLSLPILPN